MKTFGIIILSAVLAALVCPATAGDAPPSFTVGSPKECVEAAQGAPDRIDSYPALGYDIWRYGYSQVRISVKTGRVLEWVDIAKNLKAVDPERAPAPAVNPTRQSGQSVDVHFDASFDASVNQTNNGAQSVNQPPGFIGFSGNSGGGFSNGTRRGGGRRGEGGFNIPGVPNNIPGVPGILNGPGYGSLDITINNNSPNTAANNNGGGAHEATSAGKGAAPAGGQPSKDFFAVGSSKDDVLRLQGNPDRVDRYPALGYDIWHYGMSQVRISVKTGEVMECIDFGRNLKTRQ